MSNYTSLEQSKRLVDIGLDPATADMWWNEIQPEFEIVKNDEEG